MVISVVSSPARCRSEVTFPAYGCGSRSPSSHADPALPKMSVQVTGTPSLPARRGPGPCSWSAGARACAVMPRPGLCRCRIGWPGGWRWPGRKPRHNPGVSAQLLKEGEQAVRRAVAARADARRGGPVEGPLVERLVGVDVNLGCFGMLVPEPERDHGDVGPGV